MNTETNTTTESTITLEANIVSKKGLPIKLADGTKGEKETEFNLYGPSLPEWLAHFTTGETRLVEVFNSHKVANDFASYAKACAAIVNGVSKIAKPSAARLKEAQEFMALVAKPGHVFDLRDYVAKDGRGDKDERKVMNNYAQVHALLATWDTLATEKRIAFLAQLGVFGVKMGDTKPEATGADVLATFEKAAKAPEELDLAALLA